MSRPSNDPCASRHADPEVQISSRLQPTTNNIESTPATIQHSDRAEALWSARQLQHTDVQADDAASEAAESNTSVVSETEQLKKVVFSLQTLSVNDTNFTPRPFKGSSTDNEQVERWLEYFDTYTKFRGIDGPARLQLFQLLLQDQAADWLRTTPKTDDYSELLAAFRQRFAVSDIQRWEKATAIWTREQQPGESVDTYVTDIKNMARIVPVTDETQLRFAIVRGLRNNIKLHVLQSAAQTLDDVIKAARVAEAALTATGDVTSSDFTKLTQQVGELVDHLKKSSTTVNTVNAAPSRTPSPRRVRFDDSETSSLRGNSTSNNRTTDRNEQYRLREQYQPRPTPTAAQQVYRDEQPARYNNNNRWRGNTRCRNCGRFHDNDMRKCGAARTQCFNCLRYGHLARFCLAAPAPNQNTSWGQYFGPRPQQH